MALREFELPACEEINEHPDFRPELMHVYKHCSQCLQKGQTGLLSQWINPELTPGAPFVRIRPAGGMAERASRPVSGDLLDRRNQSA